MATLNVAVELAAKVSGGDKIGAFNKELGNVGKGAKAAGLSLTDIKSGLDLAGGAFHAVEGAVKSVIDPFVELANSVEDVARNSGISATEASVLIQVTDDLRISTDTLKIANKELAKDGIQPTFANMKKLAAEYQAITDPVERAAFATKHFGKSAQEMTKLLETSVTTLDDMGAAVMKSGLIIDEQGVAKAKAYQAAMDDWNDSILSVKLAIAQDLLPAITGGVAAGAQWVQTFHAATQAVAEHRLSLLDYMKLSAQVVWTSKTMADAQAELNALTTAGTRAVGEDGQAYSAAVVPVQALTGAYDGMIEVAIRAQQSSSEQAAAMKETAAMADYLAQRSRDVAAANDDMIRAHRSWLEGVAGDVVQALHDAGVEGDLYLAALHGIDATYGTSFANEDATQKKLAAITAEFAKSGDVVAYENALKALADGGASEAAARLEEADAAAVALKADLEAIPKDWRIDVGTYYTNHYNEPGGGGSSGGSGSGTGVWTPPGLGGANGLDMIVPPGFPNDSYPLRAQSGERVQITPAGQGGDAELLALLRALPGMLGRAVRDNLQKALA